MVTTLNLLEKDSDEEECVSDRSSTCHTGSTDRRNTSNDVLLQPDTLTTSLNIKTQIKKNNSDVSKVIFLSNMKLCFGCAPILSFHKLILCDNLYNNN